MPRPMSLLELWQRAGFPVGDLAHFRMEDDGGAGGGDDKGGAGGKDGGDDKGGKGGAGGSGGTDDKGGAGSAYPEGLGDAGKRALDSERDARARAERELKDANARLEKLEKDAMSDSEKAIAKAKEEGKAEALTVANERLVRAEVKAAAGGKFADPDDAVAALVVSGQLKEFKVDDRGNVDTKEISKALDALLERKPHLAARARRPSGSGDGGARKDAPTGTDMSALIRQRAGRH